MKPAFASFVHRIGPAALATVAACFSGDITIGSVCVDAGDCGKDQQCRHELCGRCGNGAHEPSELCYADPVVVDGLVEIQSFRIADLDGDNRDELVTLDDAGVLGHAFGSALMPSVVDAPPGIATFALGDADGDGDGEIVVGAGTLIVVLGREGEAFVPVLEIDAGHVLAEATVVAALDAAATLAFVDADGSLFVIALEAGAVARPIDVGTQVHIGPAVYFDDDDALDLAFVDERQNRMGVVTGGTWDAVTRVDVGRGPIAVVGYDRDRDGRVDFMTVDRFGHTVSLVATSTNHALSLLDSLAFDAIPAAATAFDADFDGVADVLVGTDDAVEFWRGEAGRHPEAVRFDDGAVTGIGVGRFSAAPVFEVFTLADGRVRRQAVMP